MPPRAPLAPRAASAQPAPFTPQDERKLRSGLEQYGRQWSLIHKRLFSKSGHAFTVVKSKGISLLKASPASKARVVKAKRILKKSEGLSYDRLLKNFSKRRVQSYLQFLALKAAEEDYDCEKLSPTAEEDEVWHHHIIDTRHYRLTCEALCGPGNFIDHDPEGGDDVEARNARREYTDDLREEVSFGEDQPKIAAPVQRKSIKVKLAMQDGTSYFFEVNSMTPVQALMDFFCARYGTTRASVRFLFGGVRIQGDQTPQDLGMESGDAIDVVAEQVGC